MKPAILAFAAALMTVPAAAQVFPRLSQDTPRIQSVVAQPDRRIILTALPETALTVMLEHGQVVKRITLDGNRSWDVRVSAEADSFQVTPQKGAAPAILYVETSGKSYEFGLETSLGLQAGYIVRLISPQSNGVSKESEPAEITGLDWTYKLRGDRSVRPSSIRDNGIKTVIEYAPGQALPAVFAIGPSGDEEVVDGYMRGDQFVIDRVHQELIFRIDKEKATARRNKREGNGK